MEISTIFLYPIKFVGTVIASQTTKVSSKKLRNHSTTLLPMEITGRHSLMAIKTATINKRIMWFMKNRMSTRRINSTWQITTIIIKSEIISISPILKQIKSTTTLWTDFWIAVISWISRDRVAQQKISIWEEGFLFNNLRNFDNYIMNM